MQRKLRKTHPFRFSTISLEDKTRHVLTQEHVVFYECTNQLSNLQARESIYDLKFNKVCQILTYQTGLSLEQCG